MSFFEWVPPCLVAFRSEPTRNHTVGASQEHVVSVSPAHVDTPAVSGLTGACGRSKYCACHEIGPHICTLAGCFRFVCVLI